MLREDFFYKDSPMQELDYPCLMETEKGAVILMSKPNTGTVVISGITHKVGKYREDWAESSFKPFSGNISLRNA